MTNSTGITGYRDLTPKEKQTINECKQLGEELRAKIEKLERGDGGSPDMRSLAIAKTQLQTGMMWLIKAIAKPDSF